MEKSDKKIELYITGMTCVNCQNKIEKRLKHTKGIHRVTVSYNKGTAIIFYAPETISLQEIVSIIENLGYQVILDKRNQKPTLTKVIFTLSIIAALYFALQMTGILNLLVPSQLADSKMGYGMLFVIGLLTSVHCIAMCGGINLSQCIPQAKPDAEADTGKLTAFYPALLYNLGRVVSYTAIGFVMGLLGFFLGGGTQVGMSTFFQGILKIAAGIFMVVMGINMLGLFPELKKFTLRMPKSIARKIGKEKSKNSRPFIVGILNGFMPCGPLQSMWIVAVATGNPFEGAFSMFLFSLGTVPLMLGFGSLVSALGKKFTDTVMNVGAVMVTVLGLAMLSQGGSLSGLLLPGKLMILIVALCVVGILVSIPTKKKAPRHVLNFVSAAIVTACILSLTHSSQNLAQSSGSSTEAEMIDDVQVVTSTLEADSYPNITVKAGVPVKWIIDAAAENINGCNNRIIIPQYGMEYTFQPGENVIEFTPSETGAVAYSCWMGMIHGNIFVTEDGKVDSTMTANAGTSSSCGCCTASSYGTSSNDTSATENTTAPTDSTDSTLADGTSNIQVVNSTLTSNSYPNITVKVGTPVKWIINAPEGSINSCNNRIQIPEYNIEYSFQTGENVIEFTPAKTGAFQYSCWMGMLHGNIFVVDGTESASLENDAEVTVPVPSGYTIPTEQIAVAKKTTDSTGNTIQKVNIELTDEGFSPAVIVVEKDLPTIWTIDNLMTDAGNENALIAPYYSTKLSLKEGENQLSFSPTDSFEASTGGNRFYCYI